MVPKNVAGTTLQNMLNGKCSNAVADWPQRAAQWQEWLSVAEDAT